jgi:hypothetical protein
MAHFTLNIELGNAAMESPQDVAAALRKVADRLERIESVEANGRIGDLNGNTVGSWNYAPPESEEDEEDETVGDTSDENETDDD